MYREDRGSDRGRLRAAWRGRHTVVTVRGFCNGSCREVLIAFWSSSSESLETPAGEFTCVWLSSSVLLQLLCKSFSSFSLHLMPFRGRECVVHCASGTPVVLGEPKPWRMGATGGCSSMNAKVSCWQTATCLWWHGWRRARSSWTSLRPGDSPEPWIHMLGLSPRQRKA